MKLQLINEMFDDVELGNDVHMDFRDDFMEYAKIIDGAQYVVEFQNDGSSNIPDSVVWGYNARRIFAERLGGVWGVDLSGPQRFASTGKGNFAAVYGFLLASIRHAIINHNVNAISFSAYEPGMQLVYNKFVKTFQKSNNLAFQFRDIKDGLLISERGLQSLDEDMVAKLRGQASDTAANSSNELKDIRRSKILYRQFKHWLKKRVEYDGVIWTINSVSHEVPGVNSNRWDDGELKRLFFTPEMLENVKILS